MTSKQQSKRPAYATRSGRTPIGVTASPEEHALIREAAEIDGRPMSQFVLRAGLAAARKILEKNSRKD